MQHAPFATALVVLFAACQSASPTGPQRSDVLGEWAWVSSSGGIAGSVLSPQTEGYQAVLELRADGTARAFRDGALVGSSHYLLQERLSLVAPGSDPEYQITFDPPLELFAHGALETYVVRTSENGRRLTFEAPCCDLFGHTFVKAALQ